LQSIIVSLLTEAKLASEQAMTVDKTNPRYVYRAFRIVIVLAMSYDDETLYLAAKDQFSEQQRTLATLTQEARQYLELALERDVLNDTIERRVTRLVHQDSVQLCRLLSFLCEVDNENQIVDGKLSEKLMKLFLNVCSSWQTLDLSQNQQWLWLIETKKEETQEPISLEIQAAIASQSASRLAAVRIAIRLCTQLQELNLNGLQQFFIESAIVKAALLSSSKSVHIVNLRELPLNDELPFIIEHWTALREVDLNGAKLTKESFQSLSQRPLQRLSLRKTEALDEYIQSTLQSQLLQLDISENPELTYSTLKKLSEIAPTIHQLSIGKTGINIDQTSLEPFTHLEKFDTRDCAVQQHTFITACKPSTSLARIRAPNAVVEYISRNESLKLNFGHFLNHKSDKEILHKNELIYKVMRGNVFGGRHQLSLQAQPYHQWFRHDEHGGSFVTVAMYERTTTHGTNKVIATDCLTGLKYQLQAHATNMGISGQSNIQLGDDAFTVKFLISPPNVRPPRTDIKVFSQTDANNAIGSYNGLRNELIVESNQRVNLIIGIICAFDVLGMSV